jgi:multisubunit Na+/H+ antiporter MnhF subunit
MISGQTKSKNNKFYLFLFILLWLWIAFISCFDSALTILLKNQLHDFESNPVARIILEYDQWEPSRFIGLKMFGTILVLGVITLIYSYSKKFGFTILISIALVQTVLFLYLLGLSDKRSGVTLDSYLQDNYDYRLEQDEPITRFSDSIKEQENDNQPEK